MQGFTYKCSTSVELKKKNVSDSGRYNYPKASFSQNNCIFGGVIVLSTLKECVQENVW